MNKLFYFPFALLLFSCEQRNKVDEAQPQTRSTIAYSTGYSKDRQCIRGDGDCAVASDFIIDPKTGILSNRTPQVNVSVQEGKLVMVYLTPYDPAVKTVTIKPTEEFYVLDRVAKDLGYHSIKVKQGEYNVDRTQGKYGATQFDIEVE